jgi:hypothetical protein
MWRDLVFLSFPLPPLVIVLLFTGIVNDNELSARLELSARSLSHLMQRLNFLRCSLRAVLDDDLDSLSVLDIVLDCYLMLLNCILESRLGNIQI